MRKRNIVGGILTAAITLTATLGGCSLVSTNNTADMAQTIAEVNISEAVGEKFAPEYKDAVKTTKVIKRELVSYFISAGYAYINNYGWSAEQAFNQMVDELVENAVVTQYATMYLLQDKGGNAVTEFKEAANDIERYEHLLGEDSADVKIAKYTLMSAINAAIDVQERSFLEKSSSSSGTDKRDTPTNVNTEQDDFYPTNGEDDELYYNFYTGYEGYLLKQSGVYADDALEGTKKATRIKAYNKFMKTYASNGIVDAKTEDLSDIWSLKYIQEQYVNQLKQRVINKYYDLYEEEQETQLNVNNYAYVKKQYENMLLSQSNDYTSYKSDDAFASALGDMSDTSFVLYAPNTEKDDVGSFGFVYNILLPFSSSQSVALSGLQSKYADEDYDGGYKPEYYKRRNDLLKKITATDQRAAWFNGETDHAFDAKAAGIEYYGPKFKLNGIQYDRDWLFFENNLTKPDRYKSIDKYYGKYSYNGTVVEKDDEYVLTPNKLSIDDMLEEFKNYIDYVLDANGNGGSVSYNTKSESDYYKNYDKKALYKEDEDVVNYENFIYSEGSVDFGSAWSRADAFTRGTVQYDVLSAVNELQYAYTTDTGVLSQYVGYSVNAVDTDYIKEFEYAAQKAVNAGAGNFTVCAGDYGWHLIYVTYTFDAAGGEQFTTDWEARIETEGTFENIFYNWLKDKAISEVSTTRRKQIIAEYNNDKTVTKYQKAYQDLLDMDV